MLNLRDRLLLDLMKLNRRARIGDVEREVTGKFNLIIGQIHDELKLDLRGLMVRSDEHNIPPPTRHADAHGPLTPEEVDACLMSAQAFRAKVEEAVTRLDEVAQ